jgi:hypothetical protein
VDEPQLKDSQKYKQKKKKKDTPPSFLWLVKIEAVAAACVLSPLARRSKRQKTKDAL